MSNENQQEITIAGDSMRPMLTSGHKLLFSMDASPLIGDICLIRDAHSRELIVHRLVSLSPYTFKGDNSLNIEQGDQFTLLGVSLESRKIKNRVIAVLSLRYQFKKSRVIRIFCKLLIKILCF